MGSTEIQGAEMCLLQTRHSLTIQRLPVSLCQANRLKQNKHQTMSFFQIICIWNRTVYFNGSVKHHTPWFMTNANYHDYDGDDDVRAWWAHVNSQVVCRKPSLVHINLPRGNIIKSYELLKLWPIFRQSGLGFKLLGKNMTFEKQRMQSY